MKLSEAKCGGLGGNAVSKSNRSNTKSQKSPSDSRSGAKDLRAKPQQGEKHAKQASKAFKFKVGDGVIVVNDDASGSDSRRVKVAKKPKSKSKGSEQASVNIEVTTAETIDCEGMGEGHGCVSNKPPLINNLVSDSGPDIAKSHNNESSTSSSNLNTEMGTLDAQTFLRDPKVLRPVIDRLAMTVKVPSELQSAILWAVSDLEEQEATDKLPTVVMKGFRKGSRYHESLDVVDAQGMVLGIIELDPIQSGNISFFRIDLNPGKLNDHQQRQFNRVVKVLLGQHFKAIMSQAKLTLFDVAIDIINILRSSVLSYSNRAGQSAVWGRFFNKGQLDRLYVKTQQHGDKRKSKRSVTIYDKRQEQIDKGVQDAHLKRPRVRVEGRCRPSVKVRGADGKTKMRYGAYLHELHLIYNPFGNINLAVFPLPPEGDWSFEMFLLATKQIGVDAALSKVTDETQRRRFRQRLADAQADWWHPEDVMLQVIDALKQLGLFPADAFSSATSDDE